jgi:hypothetical protein
MQRRNEMEEYHQKIIELSTLFKGIYPVECFTEDTALYKFLYPEGQYSQIFEDDHYRKDIQLFLQQHQYKQERIGSDLPWWGQKYFSSHTGVRVMVISQDSNTPDAGSITFYLHLMKYFNKSQYDSYIAKNRLTLFTGWDTVKNLLREASVDLDFLYITDGKKVYPEESLQYKNSPYDSDLERKAKEKKRKSMIQSTAKRHKEINARLLKSEIKFCNPDVIVVLGGVGLSLLDVPKKITELLENDTYSVYIEDFTTMYWTGRKSIEIAPFPSGSNNGLLEYRSRAIRSIRSVIESVKATVIAGVDLKGITSDDMEINEETKEIDITLPHAKLIQDPSLQMDKILAVDMNGLFIDDIKMNEGFEKASVAQEQIRQDAISIGLLDTAEKNAEKVLKEFFKNIGYTVNVSFN